jgi:hypothetical protein
MDLNKTFKIQAYGLDIDELVQALHYQGVPNLEIDLEPDRTGFWMIIFNPSLQQLQIVNFIFDIIERDYQANISELIAVPAPIFPVENYALPEQVYNFSMLKASISPLNNFNTQRLSTPTYDFSMPQTLDYVPTYQRRPFPTNRFNSMKPIERVPQFIGYQPYATTPDKALQDLGLNSKSYQLPKSAVMNESPQGQAIGMSPRANTPYSVVPSKPVLDQIMPPRNLEFFVPSI